MWSLLSKKYLSFVVVGAICSVVSCLFYSPDGATLQSTIVTILFLSLTLNMSIENQLYMVALSVPNTKALGLGGMSASIFVCTIAVLMYFLKEKKRQSIPILAIILILYSLQYLFRNEDYLMGVVMPIKTMANVLFFTFLSRKSTIAKDSFNVGLRAAIALFIGIVSAFVASSFGKSFEGRMTIAGNDSNMISIEVVFVLSYLSVAYFSRKQIPNVVYFMAASVLGVLSLLCGSRTGMILYAFVLLASIILNGRHVWKTTMLIGVLGIAGVVFLLSPMGQSIIEAITLRNEVLENADNISNGRFEIWDQYFAVLNSNDFYWLFGLGSYSDYGLEEMAHNFLIEDVAAYGIIGVLLLYSTYVGVYRKQYWHSYRINHFKYSFFYRLPFWVPLIGSLTLHGLGSIMITTMLYLGVLCMTGAQVLSNNNNSTR